MGEIHAVESVRLRAIGRKLIEHPSGNVSYLRCACGCASPCHKHQNPVGYKDEVWCSVCLIEYLAGLVEEFHGTRANDPKKGGE
jgi:hypothetical protein